MRKNILTLCILSLITLGACTKSADDSTDEAQSSVSSREALQMRVVECPPGYHPSYTYEIDVFNFHKPRTGCKSGFGLCIKGHWETGCVPNRPYSYFSTIKEGVASVWAQELENGKLEIHFPLALKDTEGYSAEDLAIFNMDEEYEIYKGITLKPGDYPVQETDVELVVIVDIL
jgi:hypothetical protein